MPRLLAFLIVLLLLLPACASADAIDAHHHELRKPTGDFAGQPPRGYVIVLHFGAWRGNNAEGVAKMRADANRLRGLGYATLNTTYASGGRSMGSVVGKYDALRDRVGSEVPICAMGSSAGGHLALALATRRRSLDCAFSQGAPTDLPRLQGPVREAALRAFGSRADDVSPALLPRPSVPMLVAHNDHDVLVNPQQAKLMRGRAQVVVLPGDYRRREGVTAWSGHSYIESDALAYYHRVERRFLERAAR